MSDIAIRVENLSKLYHLGVVHQRPDTLRDALTGFVPRISRKGKDNSLNSPNSRQASDSDDLWALKDVSFEVKRGEVVGIIGRNGAGKSTLLKILSRITEPTSGHAEIHGRVGSLLEVGTGFHPELTGRENIFLNGAILGMHRVEIQRSFDEIVAFSEIERFLDTPVKRYSSGMYVRLAFAVAAHLEPEILLVDEVLAVGDAQFQNKCLGKMGDVAKEGRTVVFVSHNMIAVEHICQRGILLGSGTVESMGPINNVIDYYQNLVFSRLNDAIEQLPANVLYEKRGDQSLADFEVVRITVLDLAGNPKSVISTWDGFKFRIQYYANQTVISGSVALMVFTRQGQRVLLLSTQPDSTLPLQIRPGYHHIDCIIEQLPLASGEYVIGAGLAVPKKEWLWKNENLAMLRIKERDVYRSGLAPTLSRCLIATPHRWSLE